MFRLGYHVNRKDIFDSPDARPVVHVRDIPCHDRVENGYENGHPRVPRMQPREFRNNIRLHGY